MRPTVDTAQIAAMARCCRRHATSRIVVRPDFPKPVVNLSQKHRLWDMAEVEAFLRGRR